MTEANGFFDALRAGGPSEDLRGARDLYGALIGSWEGESWIISRRRSAPAERGFHFAWVSRARRPDLWIVPPAPTAAPPPRRRAIGTEPRCACTARSTPGESLTNPVTGPENHLVRRRGDGSSRPGDAAGRLALGLRGDPEDAFHWRGELVKRRAASTCETEFFGRRKGKRTSWKMTLSA
jgi:hypothetical protein